MWQSVQVFFGLADNVDGTGAAAPAAATAPPPVDIPGGRLIDEQLAVLKRALGDLQKETRRLDREEAVQQRRIKEYVERNEIASARLGAKQLFQTRRMRTRVQRSEMRMQGIDMNLRATKTNATIAMTAGKLAAIVATLNRAISPQQVQHSAQALAYESEKFKLSNELIEEALDSFGEADDDDDVDADAEEDEAAVVDRILEECNFKVSEAMPAVGGGARRVPAPVPVVATADPADSALSERLEKLRR